MAELRLLEGVKNVRCLGMIAALELGESEKDGYPRAQAIKQILWRQGILVRPLGNVIYLMPPFITPNGLLAEAISRLAEALKKQTKRRNSK